MLNDSWVTIVLGVKWNFKIPQMEKMAPLKASSEMMILFFPRIMEHSWKELKQNFGASRNGCQKWKAIRIDLYFLTIAGFESLDVLNSFSSNSKIQLWNHVQELWKVLHLHEDVKSGISEGGLQMVWESNPYFHPPLDVCEKSGSR